MGGGGWEGGVQDRRGGVQRFGSEYECWQMSGGKKLMILSKTALTSIRSHVGLSLPTNMTLHQ